LNLKYFYFHRLSNEPHVPYKTKISNAIQVFAISTFIWTDICIYVIGSGTYPSLHCLYIILMALQIAPSGVQLPMVVKCG